MKHLFPLIFIFTGLTANSQNISRKQFIEEIDITRNFLLDLHPDPFEFQSKSNLALLIDSITSCFNSVDSISELVAYQNYSKIISSIRCGHSGVYLPSNLNASIHRFPFEIRIINGEGIIIKGISDSTLVGSRIQKINGVSWNAILNSCTNFHSSDAYSLLNQGIFEKRAGLDISVFLNNPEKFEISLFKKNGDSIVISELPKTSTSKSQVSPLFEFRPSESNKNIAIITIHNFPIDKKTSDEFEEFCTKTVKKIKKAKTKNVIIDLRDNGGGDRTDLLLRFFADKSFPMILMENKHSNKFNLYKDKVQFYNMKNDSSGYSLYPIYFPEVDFQKDLHLNVNLYVFVNKLTSSAASHFTSLVKEHKLGKIVGEETGGRQIGNNGSAYSSYFLPYSGIEIYIPLVKIKFAVDQNDNINHGVLPDISIKREMTKELEMKDLIKIVEENNSN